MKASTCIYIIDNLWRALLILAIKKKKSCIYWFLLTTSEDCDNRFKRDGTNSIPRRRPLKNMGNFK